MNQFLKVNKLLQNINKNIKAFMSTYKEKYHLKKTEPIKSKQRITYLNYAKEPVKGQKASTIKNIPVRRGYKDRYSNNHIERRQQQRNDQNNKESQKQIKDQNENDSSKLTIQQRSHSVSIVQKFTPSSNYQPLQYRRKNAIQSLQKINILSSVQNFFNRIIKPDNGCICDEPCQWSAKLFKWVDVPQFLAQNHYEQLQQKVKIINSNKKTDHQNYFHLLQLEEEAKQQQLRSFKQIIKDIPRTQSQSLTFQNPTFRKRLENILKCYVVEDPKIGYIQGMNMILAGILYHVKQQAKTYSIFRKLLYSIRSVYLDNFRQCYIHINKIEKLLQLQLFDVYAKLGELQIQLEMICLPWILSLLTSVVPLDSSHLIYYGFIKQKWTFIYKVCLSVFAYFKETIKEATQASQILMLFSPSQDQFKEMDWDDIVKYGQKIQISFNN